MHAENNLLMSSAGLGPLRADGEGEEEAWRGWAQGKISPKVGSHSGSLRASPLNYSFPQPCSKFKSKIRAPMAYQFLIH
jgi:hypothetical protein